MHINQLIISKMLLLFVVAFTTMPGASMSQPADYSNQEVASTASDGGKYALLVRKFRHLKGSIKTAGQMKADADHQVKAFEVVIIGKAVKRLKDSKEVSELMAKGQDLDIRFSVCRMAMQKLGVKEADLPEGMQVVPNGFIRVFELQEQDYHVIQL